MEEDKDNGQCRRDLVCAALGLENNGTCQEKENDHTCICAQGFSGKNCEIGNHFHTL